MRVSVSDLVQKFIVCPPLLGRGGGREAKNIRWGPDTLLAALYSLIISTHVRLRF
jgi:hypothetical protein